MDKELKIILGMMLIGFAFAFAIISPTYSLLRNNSTKNMQLKLADWDVSLVQNGVDDSLTVIPGTSTATYNLNIRSLSEVDVKYTIVISNLPVGVEVSIDNGTTFEPQVNNAITFANAGTIPYSASGNQVTKTLIFRATSGATLVNNQAVNIDVIAEQVL